MKRDPEREEYALGVDVLAPEGYGEVIGGGERATSIEFLEQQIAAHDLPKEAFEWYLDLRRSGGVPPGRFGMGAERCAAWMLVIGITMNQFTSEPNRYLTEKIPSAHFYERLQRLITRSVGYIALRGGMGTVTEISLVWNKLQTRVLEPRPIVLLGDCWPPVVE